MYTKAKAREKNRRERGEEKKMIKIRKKAKCLRANGIPLRECTERRANTSSHLRTRSLQYYLHIALLLHEHYNDTLHKGEGILKLYACN